MGQREDLELAEQVGLQGDKDVIAAYARLIRMEFYDVLRTERDTWLGSKFKPLVEIALEHCLKRIDPDASL